MEQSLRVELTHEHDARMIKRRTRTAGSFFDMRADGATGDTVHPPEYEMARTPALKNMSVAELQREISRRQRSVVTLQRRRAKLARQLASLDAQIASSGGSARGGWSRAAGVGRTRAKNESSLLDALAKLLKGRTMSVTEAAEAVQRAGYKTVSPNFRTIVNQTLLKKKFFKRVGRGQYTAA